MEGIGKLDVVVAHQFQIGVKRVHVDVELVEVAGDLQGKLINLQRQVRVGRLRKIICDLLEIIAHLVEVGSDLDRVAPELDESLIDLQDIGLIELDVSELNVAQLDIPKL